MIELENSDNLQDRIKFHAFLKEALVRSIKMAEECDDDHLKELELKYIKNLKERIARYDVYRQKVVSRCKTCNEEVCVCYILQEEIKPQELDKLF